MSFAKFILYSLWEDGEIMKKKKLTYNSLAMSTLKNRKKSYALMIIGIVLAMIFSSGVPFFASCLQSSQKEMQYRKQGKQDTIVTNAQNYELNKAIEDGSIIGEIGYAHILSYAWNEKEDFSDGTMIGWLDERATELYYPVVLDGRMPEKENEIAIEKSALQRMRLDTKIGEEITLKALVCNSDEFLEEEKLKDSDACVSLTGIDEENIITSLYAKEKGVPKVVTKVDKPSIINMASQLNLDTIVSPKDIIANHIIRFVRAHQTTSGNSIKTLYKIHDMAEALEFIVDESFKNTDIPLKDLRIRENVLIGGIVRDGKFILPDGRTTLKLDDKAIVLTIDKQITELNQIIKQ